MLFRDVIVAGLTLISVTAFGAAVVGAADYVIDTEGAHASIQFKVKHLGYSWLTGRFDKFSGTFSYDEAAPENSKVEVKIDPASVNSNHGKRDKHLRSADFLDVDTYPEASFVSKSVKAGADGKMTIVGDFTLRGVTKELTIEGEAIGGGKDPWGGYRQGFTGTTSFALADFGITYNLGPASKEVFLMLDVEGLRK